MREVYKKGTHKQEKKEVNCKRLGEQTHNQSIMFLRRIRPRYAHGVQYVCCHIPEVRLSKL